PGRVPFSANAHCELCWAGRFRACCRTPGRHYYQRLPTFPTGTGTASRVFTPPATCLSKSSGSSLWELLLRSSCRSALLQPEELMIEDWFLKSRCESLRFPAAKFPHRQRRLTLHLSVRCLSFAIAAFETSFLGCIVRCPCGAGGVSLQESRDLFFGKIGALHVEVRFRNAPAISKDHQVKIPILLAKDAH